MQAIHHAEVVEVAQNTATFPGGMFKQVQKLTIFIKLPSPNGVLMAKKIKENAHKWMFNNMDVLQKHYNEVTATIVKLLPNFEQVASEKAILFAKMRYKHRLTPQTIESFKKKLITIIKNDWLEWLNRIITWWGLTTNPVTWPPLQAVGDRDPSILRTTTS